MAQPQATLALPTLAPRAPAPHAREPRSDGSEGADGSTAAYATRNGARPRHFWAMNDPLGAAETGAVPADIRRACVFLAAPVAFAAGCATSASPRSADKRRIAGIRSPPPLLVAAATVTAAPATTLAPPRPRLPAARRRGGARGKGPSDESPGPS